MTEIARELALKTFEVAIRNGAPEQPEFLRVLIAAAQEDTDETLSLNNVVEQAIAKEFPFLRPLSEAGTIPDGACIAKWTEAVSSVLIGLRSWNSGFVNSLSQLRAWLAAAHALDVGSAGLGSVGAQLRGGALASGILQIIQSTDIGPFGGTDRRFPNLQQELKQITAESDYERLHQMLPYLMPEFRQDVWAAVVLLWKLDPYSLAKTIVDKDDVHFSLFVCMALNDSAAVFARCVALISFKFIAITRLRQAHRISDLSRDWPENLQQLLLEVSKTPDWAGWMIALFKYPSRDPQACNALADSLAQLREEHWIEFIRALSLEHSHAAAQPVADIMVRFASKAGEIDATVMWAVAFKEWNNWDYSKANAQAHMFAPMSCALDYPVAMHYSQWNEVELHNEEARLVRAVEALEQTWFESASDLITERNRLLSRLRLVRHAPELASGRVGLLPPPVQPDPSPYILARYSYFDVTVR